MNDERKAFETVYPNRTVFRAMDPAVAAWEAWQARATLPQPAAAQEPVAWRWDAHDGICGSPLTHFSDYCPQYPVEGLTPLYASLPPAVRLSDSEITEIARDKGDEVQHGFIFNKDGPHSVLSFARAVLAAASAPKTEGDGNAS